MNRRGFLKSLVAGAIAGPAILEAAAAVAPVPLPPPVVAPQWVFGEITLVTKKLVVLVKVPNELIHFDRPVLQVCMAHSGLDWAKVEWTGEIEMWVPEGAAA